MSLFRRWLLPGPRRFAGYGLPRQSLTSRRAVAVQRIGTTQLRIMVILRPDGRPSSQFQLTLVNGTFPMAVAKACKHFPAHRRFRVEQALNASLTISGPITQGMFNRFRAEFPEGAFKLTSPPEA